MQHHRTRGGTRRVARHAHVLMARRGLRDALDLLEGTPADDELLEAQSLAEGVVVSIVDEINARREARGEQEDSEPADVVQLDARGYRRPPQSKPGHNRGKPPGNAGRKYPADPPTIEEIVRVLAAVPKNTHGERLRALILILWRAGLRISEALSLMEGDLDRDNGTVFVRQGKGGKPRTVGIDDWVWEHLEPWLEIRKALPIGPLFCVLTGPTAGRAWGTNDARTCLKDTAAAAGVRRRVAPHQLRHALAVELVLEGVSPVVIQRQLGHANLQITTVYLQGFPQSTVIQTMRARPVPTIPALAAVA